MEKKLELNSNLLLTGIDENNCQDGELIAVELFLTFLGKDGNAFVVIENLEDEYPRYAMTEIASEVSSSFNDALEEQSVWEKIVSEVKKYVSEWKLENSY